MSASLLRVPSVLLLLDMSKELLEAVSIVLWFVLYQRVVLHDIVDVLVTTTGEIDQDVHILAKLLGHLDGVCHRMTGFEGGDDAFHTTQTVERFYCLAVGGTFVVHPADGVQVAVLGTDTRIVQATGDGVDRKWFT